MENKKGRKGEKDEERKGGREEGRKSVIWIKHIILKKIFLFG